MSRAPLMPKATAVWLVENTALTFRQISDFAGLHELEVKGIADGDVAQGIKAFKKGMSEDDTAKVTTEPSDSQKTIDHRPPESNLQARAQTEQKAEGSNV